MRKSMSAMFMDKIDDDNTIMKLCLMGMIPVFQKIKIQ